MRSKNSNNSFEFSLSIIFHPFEVLLQSPFLKMEFLLIHERSLTRLFEDWNSLVHFVVSKFRDFTRKPWKVKRTQILSGRKFTTRQSSVHEDKRADWIRDLKLVMRVDRRHPSNPYHVWRYSIVKSEKRGKPGSDEMPLVLILASARQTDGDVYQKLIFYDAT